MWHVPHGSFLFGLYIKLMLIKCDGIDVAMKGHRNINTCKFPSYTFHVCFLNLYDINLCGTCWLHD
jgi:hypothetical protein